MESSSEPWEEETGDPADGDAVMNATSAQNPSEEEDRNIPDVESDCHITQAEGTPISESSLEVRMKDMMSLDTTGQDFVIVEHSCVHNGKEGETPATLIEEPKMCNEKTATYWTGGGGDSLHEEEFTSFLEDDRLVDTGQESPQLLEEMKPVHNNGRIHLPLKKTLRNLRLLDLKLKYNSHQFALDNPVLECSNESSSSSEESDSEFPELIISDHYREEAQHNSYLIDLLTQCHYKLEQLEEMRLSSHKMSWSLWEAETTIEKLKEKVSELHRENVQKEEEIFFLREELVRCGRLLHLKAERAVEEERPDVRPPERCGESQKQQCHFQPIGTEHDRPGANNRTAQKDSTICVIL
ncbi:uncharacterized protein [Hyperolius riggenbachi]|uniref:uncharacterized protein n=1 Tax=Hyperolius riggenbachi TaxID=752182 RepID=UPI0035A2E3AA